MNEAPERRVLVGRYEIAEVLGRTARSTVYRGRDLESGRPVAVKVLAAELSTQAAALARFRREASAAARLSHPNVVSVYDSGVDHGEHYLVMELVTGSTLRELLRERGPLPAPLALALADDVLRALAAAHEDGVAHGGISPDTVLLTRDGTAKVTGFGVEPVVGPDADQTISVEGSSAAVAPERGGGRPPSPATDLYDAGSLLYWMLTGRPPVAGDETLSLASRHRDERLTPPSALRAGLTPAVDALVLKALRERPQDRFATARDMQRAVEHAGVPLPPPGLRLAQHGPSPARGRGQIYPHYIPTPRRRSRSLIAGIAALVVAAVGTVLLAAVGVLSSQSTASFAGTPTSPVATPGATTPADTRPSVRTPINTLEARTAPPVGSVSAAVTAEADPLRTETPGVTPSATPPAGGGPKATTPPSTAPATPTPSPATPTPSTTVPAPTPVPTPTEAASPTAAPSPPPAAGVNPDKGPKNPKPGSDKQKD